MTNGPLNLAVWSDVWRCRFIRVIPKNKVMNTLMPRTSFRL